MKRLNLINAIGEAVIPIAGLLFFDWGIYFILLFYFIDLIATEVFLYIKVNKIIQFQRIKFAFSLRYGRILFSSFLALSTIVLAHIATCVIVPNINFYDEFIAFLSYEEMGFPVPQGYILLPLVILGNLQQYKLTFIKTGIYKVVSWKNLILSRRRALFIALIGGVLSIIITYLFPMIPTFVYVLLIVGIKFYIDAYLTLDKL